MSNQPLHHTKNIREFNPLDSYAGHGGFAHHYESNNYSIFQNQWKVGVADANARAAASVASSKAHSDIWTSFWGNFGNNATGLGNGLVGVANFSLAMKKIFGDDDDKKSAHQDNHDADAGHSAGTQGCENLTKASDKSLKTLDNAIESHDVAKIRTEQGAAVGQKAKNSGEIARLTGLSRDLDLKNGNLKASIDKNTPVIKANEETISTNTTTISQNDKAIASAKESVEGLRKLLKDPHNTISSDELNRQIGVKEAEIRAKEEENKKLTADNKKLIADNTRMKDDNKLYADTIQANKGTQEGYKTTIADLEAKNKDLGDSIEKATRYLTAMNGSDNTPAT